MNLTRRGPRFTFQKRVPSDLAERFGASPIRLPLPPCGAREAQRLAALLGGQLEVRFMEARLAGGPEDEDPRDAVIRGLMEMLERAHGMRPGLVAKKDPTAGLRHSTERLHGQDALRGELTDFAARLDRLQDRKQDHVARHAAPAVGDEILARLAAMEQQLAANAASQAQVTALAEAVDRSTAVKLGPLFGEAWPAYLAHQVEGPLPTAGSGPAA